MRIAVFCDVFPELSETFVVGEIAALERAGAAVRVVALERARTPHPAPGLDAGAVRFLGEAGRAEKARAGARLLARAPARALRDARGRRGWRPAEEPRRTAALAAATEELRPWGAQHLHAHFAAGAAMEALRAGALLGVPVSVTAHAHDIFRTPRNLERKLRAAAFVTTGCAYNVRHLRGVAPGAEVHEIVMGVDLEAFTRTSAHPARGPVLAVGRLVEKKGFGDLIRACADLREAPGFAGAVIVGDGPLRGELVRLIAEHDLDGHVALRGAQPPAVVRELLEAAAVLAMPCVVAADGDRDSMPVVVKEALAMEVPVVATNEVGLPEIVDETCGRLVAPGDPEALARALGEVLALGAGGRAALGRAGRERVAARADVHRETQRLLALIRARASAP